MPRRGSAVPAHGLTVVIPTRHRGRLACAAIGSVIRQAQEHVTVVVSDNSDNAANREVVTSFCRKQDPRLVSYVPASGSLAMTAHWEWALRQAMAISGASHFVVLTDRMVFKPGFLQEVMEIVTRHPGDVVSYNYDTVEDASTPIHVAAEPWSGRLLGLDAGHLLALSARGIYSNALPRMLNSLVPRAILDDIGQRFQSIFASVSPDFCFAYRCLAVVDRILYYDKAGLIQYAMARSQGRNYTRGIAAPEVVDFAALLGGATLKLAAAPVPQFQTVTNSLFHEYGFVKAEAQSSRFPEIDRRAYLGAIAWDMRALRDPAGAKALRQLLKTNGWTTRHALVWFAQKLAKTVARNPGLLVEAATGPMMRRRRRFKNSEDGIAWIIGHPRRQTRTLAHLWQLKPRPVDGNGAAGRNRDGEALMSA